MARDGECRFVAAPGAIDRLLLGELVGPKQNAPIGGSCPATQLGLRDSGSFAARRFEGPWTSALGEYDRGLGGPLSSVAASGSLLRLSWPSSARTKRR